jgi:DNA-binding response OmpR family regulator
VMRAERPETAVLMMSGRYSGDLGQLNKETPFLRKPFLPKILLERVRHLLNEQSGRD